MSAITNFRVDSFVSGLAIKAPVRVATDLPITLEAEQTVNSRALLVGDRVLVKDQVDPIENGIYTVETSAWQRAGDFDGSRDIVGGTVVPAYRVADGLFVYYIIDGNGNVLVPDTDSINFSLYYDPAASGTGLPVSSVEFSTLSADDAGGWDEAPGVRIQPLTKSIWVDGNLIITDDGASERIEITATGGDHFVIITTGGYHTEFATNVRFNNDFYMLQKAAAAADFTGYGQFWVRTSDDAPMFTTEAGVDFQLNLSPSFAAPLILLDEEEVRFGNTVGGDVAMYWTNAGLGGSSAMMIEAFTSDQILAITAGQRVRLYNPADGGYVQFENDGVLGANQLEMTAVGGVSEFIYSVGEWNHSDNILSRPELADYSIRHATAGSVSNVLDIDFEDGNSHYLPLTENVTTMTISNPPANNILGQIEIEILQDSPARTIAWPASVEWPGGVAPDLTTINSTHLVHLRTRNAGTTYLGTFLEEFS